MGCEVRLEDPGNPDASASFAIGNADIVAQMTAWVRGLSAESFPKLRKLFVQGPVQDTMELAVELSIALEDHPPEIGLRGYLDRLAKSIGHGDTGESARIVCGDED